MADKAVKDEPKLKVLEQRQVFECHNSACSLGAVGHPGRFTGGITPEHINVLTGRPVESVEDHEHGEGVCPNCGQKGTPVGIHQVIQGVEDNDE